MQNYNGNDERSRAVDHVQRSVSFQKTEENGACVESSRLRPLGLVSVAYALHPHSLTLGPVLFWRVGSKHLSRFRFSRKLASRRHPLSSVCCVGKNAEHDKNTPICPEKRHRGKGAKVVDSCQSSYQLMPEGWLSGIGISRVDREVRGAASTCWGPVVRVERRRKGDWESVRYDLQRGNDVIVFKLPKI